MAVSTKDKPLATQPVLTLLGHEDAGGGAESLARVPLAWAAYTPVLTSATGTLGTYTVNSARWVRLGQHVTVTFDVSITSAGTTPGGDVRLTLPADARAASAYAGAVHGREAVSGNLLGGVVDGALNRALVSFNAGTFAGSNGNRLIGTITYEAD